MIELTDDAARLLESHHGIISVPQLISVGYSRTAIDKLQRHGVIEEVLQGAYRLRGLAPTFASMCAAVCTAHPSIAISGPSAGRLWRFRRLPAPVRIADAGLLKEQVHVLAPPGARPTVKRWVKVYRTAAIHPGDVIERGDGIRLTSRPRTVLDLARHVDAIDLLSITEQAMRDGGHTLAELREVAIDWRSPRRAWLDRYLQTLDRLLPGGAAESHPEVIVGAALVDAGVTGLVRQFSVDLPGYGPARFDLAVPDLRWAIEIDVFPTHRETAGRSNDRRRDAASTSMGWTITRLTPDDLGTQLAITTDRLLGIRNGLLRSVG